MTEIITYNGAQIANRRANNQNNIYNNVKTDRFTLASGNSNPTTLSIYKINSISFTGTFTRSNYGTYYNTKIEMFTRWGTDSEHSDISLGEVILPFHFDDTGSNTGNGPYTRTWTRTFTSATDEDGYNCWNVAPIVKLGLYERYFNWWRDTRTSFNAEPVYVQEFIYEPETSTPPKDGSELYYRVNSDQPMTITISLETGSQNIHYYDDGAWQSVTPHYYDGTNWVPVRVSRYNGSSWEGI